MSSDKKVTPFTFLNEINDGKNDIMADPLMEKLYNAFIVNRGLSHFYDTTLLANEMNIRRTIPAKMQFDFLRLAVRKRKRFGKWNKASKYDNIEFVKEFWGLSTAKAEQVMPLLNDEQIDRIKSILSKGGYKKR